jgi:predicted RNA binding protein YcfA (HicA-like mRNA interferase family)
VTISGNLDDEVPRATLNSILKQSGLKEIEKDD